MEYIRKCDVCGKIWCYTDGDLKENSRNSKMALINSIGGVAAAVGGTVMHNSYFADERERAASKIVDYTKCPQCHSQKTHVLSDEEFESIQVSEARKHIDIHATATADTTIRRAEACLNGQEWIEARAYAEIVLDSYPNHVTALLIVVMAKLKISNRKQLADSNVYLQNFPQWEQILRNADPALAAELKEYEKAVTLRLHEARYLDARKAMFTAQTEDAFKKAAGLFQNLGDYKDSSDLAKHCSEKAEEIRKNLIYDKALKIMGDPSRQNYMTALAEFKKIPHWRDADEKAAYCQSRITELSEKENNAVLEQQRRVSHNQPLFVKALLIEGVFGVISTILFAISLQSATAVISGIFLFLLLTFPTLLATVIAINSKKNGASTFMRISGLIGTALYLAIGASVIISTSLSGGFAYLCISFTNLTAVVTSFMRQK